VTESKKLSANALSMRSADRLIVCGLHGGPQRAIADRGTEDLAEIRHRGVDHTVVELQPFVRIALEARPVAIRLPRRGPASDVSELELVRVEARADRAHRERQERREDGIGHVVGMRRHDVSVPYRGATQYLDRGWCPAANRFPCRPDSAKRQAVVISTVPAGSTLSSGPARRLLGARANGEERPFVAAGLVAPLNDQACM
jgi:hypothetical protein